MHDAVRINRFKMIRLLMMHGASLHARNAVSHQAGSREECVGGGRGWRPWVGGGHVLGGGCVLGRGLVLGGGCGWWPWVGGGRGGGEGVKNVISEIYFDLSPSSSSSRGRIFPTGLPTRSNSAKLSGEASASHAYPLFSIKSSLFFLHSDALTLDLFLVLGFVPVTQMQDLSYLQSCTSKALDSP